MGFCIILCDSSRFSMNNDAGTIAKSILSNFLATDRDIDFPQSVALQETLIADFFYSIRKECPIDFQT